MMTWLITFLALHTVDEDWDESNFDAIAKPLEPTIAVAVRINLIKRILRRLDIRHGAGR